MAQKLGWFVSTLTDQTFHDTRAAAETQQDAYASAGRDPGLLIRAVRCEHPDPAVVTLVPAGKAVDDKRSRAAAKRRVRLSLVGDEVKIVSGVHHAS